MMKPPGCMWRAAACALLSIILTSTRAIALPSSPLINEVLYDGPGADAPSVFTELAGPPGFSLSGWHLVGVNGGTGEVYRTVDLPDCVIPPDGILVIATAEAASELAAARDITAAVDWQNGPDAVQLCDASGQVQDALQYGIADFPAGEGSPAALTEPGQSLSRDASSTDTQDNATDFAVMEVPTPGSPVDVEPPGPADPDSVVSLLLAVPDTTCAPGDTLLVPVSYQAADEADVMAMDAELYLDGALLHPFQVNLASSALAQEWSLAFHVRDGEHDTPDTLAFSMATGTTPLTGTGQLLELSLAVADTGAFAVSPLDLELLAVNADTAGGLTQAGSVSLRGADASLAAVVTPTDSLWISVLDPDADRNVGSDSVHVYLHVGAHTDTLTAAETEGDSGAFVLRTLVVVGPLVADNHTLELAPDSCLTVTYEDRLTAAGPAATLSDTLQLLTPTDACLDATGVLQPGDSLRVLLEDADADRNLSTRDTIGVTVFNRRTLARDTLAAVEQQVSNGVFAVSAVTGSESTEGMVRVQAGDTLDVVYLDSCTVSGPALPCSTRTLIINRFGDVDGNGVVQAFDASRVLAHVLAPYLAPGDSLAANVDSLAPAGAITPYDAALILQHRVGLRARFPVQSRGSHNQPGHPKAAKCTPRRARLAVKLDPTRLAVMLDERAGLLSGEIFLEGVRGKAHLPADMAGFLLDTRCEPEGMRIVLAGAIPVFGPGEVLHVYTDRQLDRPPTVHGTFNDGRIEASGTSVRLQPVPTDYALLTNFPNPFNPATLIRFQLPVSGSVHLAVTDVLGRPVRTLVHGHRPAGFHSLRWDGHDNRGRPVGTGVYFCRMQAGRRQWVRPMLLLR